MKPLKMIESIRDQNYISPVSATLVVKLGVVYENMEKYGREDNNKWKNLEKETHHFTSHATDNYYLKWWTLMFYVLKVLLNYFIVPFLLWLFVLSKIYSNNKISSLMLYTCIVKHDNHLKNYMELKSLSLVFNDLFQLTNCF